VVRNLAGETDEFLRLFMVPGMGHCELGPGPNNFGQPQVKAGPTDAAHNLLSALAEWVGRSPRQDRCNQIREQRSKPALAPDPSALPLPAGGPIQARRSQRCEQLRMSPS
jgi:hypothetical protein